MPSPYLSPQVLKPLYRLRVLPNLKLFLIYGLWIGLGALAWNHSSPWVDWPCYAAMGYLQMSVVTFMHDALHMTLFPKRGQNWAFGIFSMIPFVISFVGFKEDHLAHHKYNRSPKDPDAFTMGRRGPLDFVLFYAYAFAGAALSIVHFLVIYPLQAFGRREMAIHLFEVALHAAVYTAVFLWTSAAGVTGEVLSVWLWPFLFFGVLNSMRFIAEHYGTPWNRGQLAGTRTVISNQVHAFFWNNINYHIGHHVYPGVPWYNLQKLHAALLPAIRREGGVVDKSYVAVFLDALRRGPEMPPDAPKESAASRRRPAPAHS